MSIWRDLPTRRVLTMAAGLGSYDPDALIYFNNIAANGGTISNATKANINTFVLSLKSAGIWDRIVDLCPMAGDQVAAAITKLKYANGGSPYCTNYNFTDGMYSESTGMTGNGFSSYLDTGQKLTTIGNSDGTNLHMAADVLTYASGRPLGVFREAIYTRHYLIYDGGSTWAWGSPNGATMSQAGFYVATRENSGNAYMYKDGSSYSNFVPDDSTPSDWPCGVFVAIGSPTGDSSETRTLNSYSAATLGGYSLGYGLSSSQAAAFDTAWAALRTALGR